MTMWGTGTAPFPLPFRTLLVNDRAVVRLEEAHRFFSKYPQKFLLQGKYQSTGNQLANFKGFELKKAKINVMTF